MKILSRAAFVLVFASAMAADKNAYAADPSPTPVVLQIDLSKSVVEAELPLPPSEGGYLVEFSNMIPVSVRYSIGIELIKVQSSPFKLTKEIEAALNNFKTIPSMATSCDEFKSNLNELKKADDETKVANLIKVLNRDIDSVRNEQKCAKFAEEAHELIKHATQAFPERPVFCNDSKIQVVLSRPDGKGKKEWKFVFKPQDKKDWTITYGLTFFPRPSISCGDTQYYSKSNGTDYTLTPLSKSFGFDVAPALFFSHCFSDKTIFGFEAGLGLDLNNPAVMLGPFCSLFDNVIIGAGGALHRQLRLKGQYSPGQTVKDTLTSEQLHDSVYVPNLYFGLSLNLDANPFKAGGEAKKEKKPGE